MARRLTEEELEQLARQASFHPGQMAALWPVSLRQMERRFLHEFNQTPAEWARAVRGRLAKDLLALGWSNKEVVKELGFANQAHLCHEFRALYNATPQSFGPGFGDKQRTCIPTANRVNGHSTPHVLPPSPRVEMSRLDNNVAFRQSKGLVNGTGSGAESHSYHAKP